METSARNTFWGTISSVRPGAVNDEIELTMPSGTKLVASITKASTERLGLVEGKEACALVKASMVILMNDADQYILSTRNQFCGTVKSVTPGAVNGEVVVDLGADGEMTSIITMGSISKLGLAEGSKVTAIVKATTFYDDPDVLAKVSRGLGEAMVGINVEDIAQPHRLAERGW